MALDFLPFETGQTITADDLNQLVTAIQDGTIFLNTTFISEQLATSSSRLNALESSVALLEAQQTVLAIREQFTMTSGQAIVNLSKTPVLDTELLSLNGLSLSKTGVPISFVGDYSVAGSTITFNVELASQILDDDLLVVTYRHVA